MADQPLGKNNVYGQVCIPYNIVSVEVSQNNIAQVGWSTKNVLVNGAHVATF